MKKMKYKPLAFSLVMLGSAIFSTGAFADNPYGITHKKISFKN